ncbi:LysR family transcriptional regulator [Shewanella sp. NFH-SH190041]|uniref:LysR substrate-binding domain-containing protein n=1 Tax=Shewanella sp. NFH-SH190041 TaxID=2950245 RepID=UPI0021C2A665|nr:LysR substrate-binding domain-containing protein [Shewanella sp. NFH-SH190041]BDM64621.1 LysR family transcriptional regulator [Shewanella sp. NFH-SH190041]
MDTDLLKTFLEVARTRHFGKAADNLFLTRSAVSFRVKQLESVLGVALFARQRNNIQLTSAGERMLVHAEAILTAWERAKQDISLSNEQSIQLAIGAVPNIWGAYLQPVLQPLHQALSGVALRTEELPHSVMSRQLLARTLDVMISFDAPQMDELEHIKLGEVELCLVSGAGDISLADVGQYPYVKVNWGTAFNIQHARDFVGLPLPSMHTGSAAMALDFVLNNQATAFLPHHLIQDGLAQGKLHLVQDAASLSRSVYLGYWGQNDRLAIIQSAIGVLQQKAAL